MLNLKLCKVDAMLYELCLLGVFATISSVAALDCYECNVWKAGYGQLCDTPRRRTDCTVCMKVETTIFMGYYKNTPRTSTMVSRVCGKSKAVSFSNECHYYDMGDGHSKRCYCMDDFCNAANPLTSYRNVLSSLTAVTFSLLWLCLM